MMHALKPRSPVHTVVVVSDTFLAAWGDRTALPDGVRMFTDADDERALDTIRRRQPAMVVLERSFAASGRGAAFVDRLRAHPETRVDIRVLAPERFAASILAQAPVIAATWPITATLPLTPYNRPTRTERRVQVPQPTPTLVSGQPASLVDLSPTGAQVTSETMLRPNQDVRLAVATDRGDVRVEARVIWSILELPPVVPAPRYRAGLQFTSPHLSAVRAFYDHLCSLSATEDARSEHDATAEPADAAARVIQFPTKVGPLEDTAQPRENHNAPTAVRLSRPSPAAGGLAGSGSLV